MKWFSFSPLLCPFLHLFLGWDSGEVAPACQCGPLDWINQRPPLEPPGFKMVFVLLHHVVALKAAAFTQPLHDLHQPDLAADRGNKLVKGARVCAWVHKTTRQRKRMLQQNFRQDWKCLQSCDCYQGWKSNICADEAAAVLGHEIKCTSPT